MRSIKVKYIKTEDFKTVFSTGIYGGVGSNGLINMTFFVDTPAMPLFETANIDDQNKTVGERKSENDADIVREVQFGTMLDLNSAKQIYEWLGKKIEEINTPKVKTNN
jgi:hypothetical protein